MNCPKCGHQVSDHAEKCPNCGCPVRYILHRTYNNDSPRQNISLNDAPPVHHEPQAPEQPPINPIPSAGPQYDESGGSNYIWLLVLLVVAVIGGIIWYSTSMNNNRKADAEKAATDSLAADSAAQMATPADTMAVQPQQQQQVQAPAKSREEEVGEQVAEISANVISEWQGIVDSYHTEGLNAYQHALPTMQRMLDEMNQCISLYHEVGDTYHADKMEEAKNLYCADFGDMFGTIMSH